MTPTELAEQVERAVKIVTNENRTLQIALRLVAADAAWPVIVGHLNDVGPQVFRGMPDFQSLQPIVEHSDGPPSENPDEPIQEDVVKVHWGQKWPATVEQAWKCVQKLCRESALFSGCAHYRGGLYAPTPDPDFVIYLLYWASQGGFWSAPLPELPKPQEGGPCQTP